MPKRNAPPAGERVTRALGHFGFFIGAIYSQFGTMPKSIVWATDGPQLIVLGIFMSTGLLGAWAALKGRYMLEYATLPFMFAGAAIYAAAMLNVVATGTNKGSGFALILVCVLMCYQIARWLSLNQLMESPWKIWGKRRRESNE